MNPIFWTQMNCSNVLEELVPESPLLPPVVIKETVEKNKCYPGFKKFHKVPSVNHRWVLFFLPLITRLGTPKEKIVVGQPQSWWVAFLCSWRLLSSNLSYGPRDVVRYSLTHVSLDYELLGDGWCSILEFELFTFYSFFESLGVISAVDRVHVGFMKVFDKIPVNGCVVTMEKSSTIRIL